MIKNSKPAFSTNKLKIGSTLPDEFGTLKKKLNFAPSGMSPFSFKNSNNFCGVVSDEGKNKLGLCK
jgi:hypothetical protein